VYRNEAYGYTLTIPPRYHGAVLLNLNSRGMLLSPGYSYKIDATEALDIQGFILRKSFVQTCRFIKKENLKRNGRKNTLHCDRLLRYEESKESCLFQCEGREFVPEKGQVPYRLKMRLIRHGDRGLELSYQYPARLEELYSEMERQMLNSLRWDFQNGSAASAPTRHMPTGSVSSLSDSSDAGEEKRWAKSYDNPRYGIHLPLPPGIFTEPISREAGRTVYPLAGGKGTLIVIVEPEKVSLRTVYEKMKQAVAKKNRITYARFFGDWFVLSGEDPSGNGILYEKAFMRNDVLALYMLLYPRELKWKLDPVIEELNRHFGPTRVRKRVQKPRRRKRLSGPQCDAMARACYGECPDDDDGCLDRCEARRDRCYDTGRF
jgi:hypothetical protein